MKNKIFALFFLCVFILTSGFGCKLVDSEVQEAMKAVTLEYWRVWDGPDAFEEIIAAYNAQHSYVTINYKKLRYDEYEQELLEAFAEDRGPDIFSIHNTWVREYQNKISPMPEKIAMVYPVVSGTIKQETTYELRTTKSLSLKEIEDDFVDVVYDDVVLTIKDEETDTYSEEVFGLPLSVDTLALFYNKDLLNNASVSTTPTYWNADFQKIVKQLTKQNNKGEIIQSGVSLGGSTNIERYSDILTLLMMQNGADMVDDNGNITFDRIPSSLKSEGYNPGLEALRFYTDFSNPAKEVYTWNSQLDNSLNLFMQGKLALFFGYSYHVPTIEAQAPKLNFSITQMPQIENTSKDINFANYWVETVSKKSENQDEAWDFIQFAVDAENVESYLNATVKPTALRALIDTQMEDDDISVFAGQVLTAKSWYKGYDVVSAEEAIGEMIDSVIAGEEDVDDIIEFGASKVQETMSD